MKVANYGWAYTALRPETTAAYEVEIHRLAEVLVHRRSAFLVTTPPRADENDEDTTPDDSTPDEDSKPKGRLLKATCKCGFIIRASKLVLDTIDITCSRCEKTFRVSA